MNRHFRTLAAILLGVLAGFGGMSAPLAAPAPAARPGVEVRAADELWLVPGTGAPRRVRGPQPHPAPKRNLTGFNHPVLSPDGRSVYVLTQAWVTSDALHRIDLATGTPRFVSAANDFVVIARGPQAGRLLVQKHTYLPGGGAEERWFLITPSGRVLGQIGDDPQKDQFLARQAAHAPGP